MFASILHFPQLFRHTNYTLPPLQQQHHHTPQHATEMWSHPKALRTSAPSRCEARMASNMNEIQGVSFHWSCRHPNLWQALFLHVFFFLWHVRLSENYVLHGWQNNFWKISTTFKAKSRQRLEKWNKSLAWSIASIHKTVMQLPIRSIWIFKGAKPPSTLSHRNTTGVKLSCNEDFARGTCTDFKTSWKTSSFKNWTFLAYMGVSKNRGTPK